MNILEITREELVNEPEPRRLATGKVVLSFNVKVTDKTRDLNTGNKFDYQNELYEVMNREPVDSPVRYLKFNCVHKAIDRQAA